MGLRSDHQAGRPGGRRGQTPGVPGPGKRFRCHLRSSLTNRGTRRFRAQGFIDFLSRLLHWTSQQGCLIVDRHPVHRAKAVEVGGRHTERIRLFFLPTSSPESKAGEFLNQAIKTNSVGRRRARDKHELRANVRGYLPSIQRRPRRVQRYFLAESVRYAAA